MGEEAEGISMHTAQGVPVSPGVIRSGWMR